jgi:NAD(P)-dependent dehydrogenase (short-subunit alcohol dehydrogenase family)
MASPNGRPLEGAVALVTGASRGIGKGIATELGVAGAMVYVTGRSSSPKSALPGTIGETVAVIRSLGGSAIALACDHADDNAVRAVFDQIEKDTSRLDLLVNNATAMDNYLESIGKPFWELPAGTWDSTMRVGLRSHFVATQLAARIMVSRRSGMIVNVSSIAAREYLLSVPFGACKAAVDKLTRDSAIELIPHNVTVASIWPGLVLTELNLAVAEWNPNGRMELLGVDLRVAETPRFSGRAVVALASDPKRLRFAGEALICAQLARDFGFTDLDGNLPPVVSANADVLAQFTEETIPELYRRLFTAPLAAGHVAGSKLGIRIKDAASSAPLDFVSPRKKHGLDPDG